MQETIGQKLRRLEVSAKFNNPLINPPLKAVAGWQANTAYAQGDVRSNGGNDYICYSPGTSASSGGPSGTGANAISDGPAVLWFFYGQTATVSDSLLAPILSTSVSQPNGLTNGYVVQTNDANFFYAGGVPSVVFSSFYRFPAITAIPGNATSNGNNSYFAVTFYTDAPKIAVFAGVSSRPFYYIIDGQYFSLSGLNPSGGATLYYVLDFSSVGGRKVRKITVESDSAGDFGGVYVDPQSQVWAPDNSDNVRAIVIGDSYTSGGNNFPIAGKMGWPVEVGKYLGWNDVWSSGLGGTGYIHTNGSSTNFIGRIQDVIAHSPDVVVIEGGINDEGNTPAQVQAAALAYYQAIRMALPTVPIIVFGIEIPIVLNANAIATENAIAAAVAQFNDSMTFFIPIATDPGGAWFVGSGNVSATTDIGNADVYISSDAVHPVQAGIDYSASRKVNAIRKVISSIP